MAPPAAGRQKSRRLGRSGPAFLERSPTPPPPSPFLHHPSSIMLSDRCSGRGCPCPRSRRRRPAEPWMAKRSRLSSERKARRAAANGRRRAWAVPDLEWLRLLWRVGYGTAKVSSLAHEKFADASASVTRGVRVDQTAIPPPLDGASVMPCAPNAPLDPHHSFLATKTYTA